MAKVLVTGASGFIGSHIVLEMLNHGYEVRGTIRDLGRAEKIKNLISEHGGDTSRLEFAQASLTDADCWRPAAEGCDGIIHVASPVPIEQPKDADEIIVPARDGALNVLDAAQALGIRRVVLTSSVAAAQVIPAAGHRVSADDWTDVSSKDVNPYGLSKTYAERAAWDFAEQHPDIELVTIQPSLVLGPALEADYGSSLESLMVLLQGKYPRLPRVSFGLVDVRDVANLHRIAYESPEAAGQRLLCSSETFWFVEIARALAEMFPDYGNALPTKELPNWVVRIVALFDPVLAFIVPSLGQHVDYDCDPAKSLGWQPRKAREAIEAGGRSLIELGLV